MMLRLRSAPVRLLLIAVLIATAAAAETITVIKPGPSLISITSSTGPNVTISGGSTTTATIVVPGAQGSPGGPIGPIGLQGERGYDGRPGTNGYDGRPGLQSIFCSISGGTRSITYDQVGLNPLPAQSPFSYMGQLVNLLRIAWNTGAGVLSGTSYATAFTPTVSSSNLFGNNYVGVMATYSSTTANGGKRYCTASTPIAVGQTGATGAKGDPGPSTGVSEPLVMTAFNTSNSANALVLQADPGMVRTKIDVRDGAAATKFYVNSDGKTQVIGGPFKMYDPVNQHMFSIASDAGGPRLQLSGGAPTGEATTYFKIGSWAGYNNFDTINRDFSINAGYNYANGFTFKAATGNVGLGTVTPATKLQVNGTVTATAVVPTMTTAATISGAYPLNLTSSTVYKLTLTGATTLSITNPRAIDSFTLYLLQGNGSGSYTMPLTASFGRTASAPVMSSTVGSTDVVDCRTVDTGVSWQCNYAGY